MNIFVVHASHRLTDHHAHGDGLIAWGFVKALAARGHRLWVVAPRIEVRELPPSDGITLFELAPRFTNKAIALIDYNFRARLLFERLSRTIHFDIVHQLNPVVRGYSFGMIGAKAPLVLGPYVGDWPETEEPANVATRMTRRFTRCLRVAVDVAMQCQARGLLITTPYARQRLPGLSAESKRLYLVPHGVDTEAYAPNVDGPLDRSAATSILMVGNATHKGVFTMIAAFERIADELPNITLTIAGGGPKSDAVKKLVAASAYRDRYRLLGPVGRESMPDVMRDSDIVCVPSFGEPFGMIVLEAMASGKPVAATDAGGVPHLLGRDSRMLFSPGDDEALARILKTLVNDRELTRITGLANRQRVVEQFAWARVARDLEAAYASVVR